MSTHEQLSADALVEQARNATGLSEFDSDSYREGLELLVAEANGCGRGTAEGLALFAQDIVHNLTNRLKIADYVRGHPEIREQSIERPVVVLGMPRTGTTLTSNLLATDPARRSLLAWIVADPVPPPRLDQLTTDPRCLAQLEAERNEVNADPTGGRFYRKSAVYPTECIYLHNHDFKSLYWESALPMPGYSEWMLSLDMTSAYDYHRMVLQMLQFTAPGSWNLKMPSHSLHIRWLLAEYPDARIVWTHRDPFTMIGSLMSLIANSQARFTGGDPDIGYISRNYPPQIAEHANRMIAIQRERPELEVYDLYYAHMMRDPIGEMQKLYGYLGDPFTDEAEAGMRAWLADNPQGKYGRHEYTLSQFGHTVDSVRPHFENYLAHYDVEPEGVEA